MAIMKLSSAVRTALASELLALLDAGTGPCELKFYTGARPTNVDTAVGAQTLLGTLVCSDPLGSVTGDVLTFDAITQDSAADATGTAAWARLLDGDGVAVLDFDVTATGGGGAITLNTVSIVAGGPILITSFTITIGGA